MRYSFGADVERGASALEPIGEATGDDQAESRQCKRGRLGDLVHADAERDVLAI
jgi:hypothetical protein